MKPILKYDYQWANSLFNPKNQPEKPKKEEVKKQEKPKLKTKRNPDNKILSYDYQWGQSYFNSKNSKKSENKQPKVSEDKQVTPKVSEEGPILPKVITTTKRRNESYRPTRKYKPSPRPVGQFGTSDPAAIWGRTENQTPPRELEEVVVTASNNNPSSTGIYEWMSKNGLGSKASYGERKKLASQYGIEGYKGTATQNNQLLEILKQQIQLGQISNGRQGLRQGVDY